MANVESDLIAQADGMGRNGARLPSELNSTGGEHDGIECCGVEFSIDEDGRSHLKKVLIEWGELGNQSLALIPLVGLARLIVLPSSEYVAAKRAAMV